MKEKSTKLMRAFVYCYLAQAIIGFAVGLALPWLYFYGVLQ